MLYESRCDYRAQHAGIIGRAVSCRVALGSGELQSCSQTHMGGVMSPVSRLVSWCKGMLETMHTHVTVLCVVLCRRVRNSNAVTCRLARSHVLIAVLFAS